MSATAAIVLIGNELLSGRVQDCNLGFLARELWQLGVSVRRASVVRDDIEELAHELRSFSASYDWVFTTGGIGPTHDDITIAGVARAFDMPITESPELAARLRSHFGDAVTEAHLRMALVPEGAVLEYDETGHSWPTVRVCNVYIFPGIPEILQRKFAALSQRFRQAPFHRRLLSLVSDEPSLVPLLDRVSASYRDVQIGSYPVGRTVVLSFEGHDHQRVDAAADEVDRLTAGIPRS
ncbi:MAG: competence/damage-inducible protein A [Acidobacteriota bacterium]